MVYSKTGESFVSRLLRLLSRKVVDMTRWAWTYNEGFGISRNCEVEGSRQCQSIKDLDEEKWVGSGKWFQVQWR